VGLFKVFSCTRIRSLSNNVFFLNRQTADRTIGGEIFSLAKTATLFADRGLRLLALSIVRK